MSAILKPEFLDPDKTRQVKAPFIDGRMSEPGDRCDNGRAQAAVGRPAALDEMFTRAEAPPHAAGAPAT